VIGTVLDDRYRVVQHLGAGAAGEVFLVDNLAADRREALKLLKTDEADRTLEGRFKREARATQLLDHPSIVATYDFGRLADGRWYMTMEYVSGTPLDGLVHKRGPLPVPMVLGMLAQIGDALHHAHERGVVHRDLKPHNMIHTKEGREAVKILDFGMAKVLGKDFAESMILSKSGDVFGTPAYMSPEQFQSQPPDPRSDIYAVGCIAFHLLVGEPPFTGKLTDLVIAHLKKPPRTPSAVDPGAGIPAELDQLVLRCLDKAADNRFQSGADLCAAAMQVPGYRTLGAPRP
jgi:serine/threonine-protein kinase